jgi:hypothetical protein
MPLLENIVIKLPLRDIIWPQYISCLQNYVNLHCHWRRKVFHFGQPPAAAFQQTQSLNKMQLVVQSEGGAGRNLLLGAHIRVKCRQFCEEAPATTFRRWEQPTPQNSQNTKFCLAPASESNFASTESSVARSERGDGRIGYLEKCMSGMEIEVGTV